MISVLGDVLCKSRLTLNLPMYALYLSFLLKSHLSIIYIMIMKINFADVKYLKINGETQSLDVYASMDGEEFEYRPTRDDLTFVLCSNKSKVVSLDTCKFYLEVYEQK